jgi:HEAT repeat protein
MNAKRARQTAIANAVEVTRSGSPTAVVELLGSPTPVVRAYVATVIARKRMNGASTQLLRAVANEPDSDARSAMTLALIILQAPESIDTLRELLGDESDEVRRLALRGLSQLADPKVLEVAPEFYVVGARFVRQEAIDALGTLGTPEAKAALLSLRAAEAKAALAKGHRPDP